MPGSGAIHKNRMRRQPARHDRYMSTNRLQHRELSLLSGILAGALLTVFAASTSLTSFNPLDLVLFMAIPSLAGALTGYSDPAHHVSNGSLVGFVVGLIYSIVSGVQSSLTETSAVLFLVLTVPIWGILGAAGAMFVRTAFAASQTSVSISPSKLCSSCNASNPQDASFCKNCGSKLPDARQAPSSRA